MKIEINGRQFDVLSLGTGIRREYGDEFCFHCAYSSEHGKRWVVREGNWRQALSKSRNEFIDEQQPSERSDELIDDTRFNSLEDAEKAFSKWLESNTRLTINIKRPGE